MSIKYFNIVLVHPEIPQNTGNIGRVCVNTESRLHLIKPLGFSMEDKYLKRAGMDYWKHVDLVVYENTDEFFEANKSSQLYFFSTKGGKKYWDCPYEKGSFLVFGNESSGLPEEIYRNHLKEMYTIPMPGKHARSMNLGNAVAVAVYEGMRQRVGGGS
ncbi:MAG TPA: tRNA (uridine(34)/cytosine(34)/5-carboxymethylaminomethyluridine(34)-2'-O)-methyltransferase TrmL [Lentisphaeria bacterium]|nr:MAG: tRNA (uridine(34)/cytosine(34)/5-carboxymethylaminomethyluridine(34)-2'-O)-methyltransferase TrmL [Lentisphaerae bacterium GWF2_50_93]HCE47044.1 tRNA (uridine(34)/cytosine(34)/5-carboxymethylaminomethyluridine(34)-2'-O)-methyltransferase TrmL [Lentisphaeria bacterium]